MRFPEPVEPSQLQRSYLRADRTAATWTAHAWRMGKAIASFQFAVFSQFMSRRAATPQSVLRCDDARARRRGRAAPRADLVNSATGTQTDGNNLPPMDGRKGRQPTPRRRF